MKKLSYIKLIMSMVIFGTIGMFVVNIPASRSFVALVRGIVGALFLLAVAFITKKRPSFAAIKKNIIPLAISGALIGANWILLFESYTYASTAESTLIYYLSPVFVLILAAILLGERITLVRAVCALTAVLGMVLMMWVEALKWGSLLALGAAVLYALVVITNKKFIRDIAPLDTTIMQLAFASLAILPYTLLTDNILGYSFDFGEVALLLLVGVLHTGFAYLFYFASVKGLKGQTVAIISYLDPIVAVILSFIFEDSFKPTVLIGAVLIVLSAVVSELFGNKGVSRQSTTNK